MRKIIITLFCFFIFLSCRSQIETSEEHLIYETISAILSQTHYLQKNQNEEFFEIVLSNYINTVDRAKLFFSQKDIDELKKYQNPYLSSYDERYQAYQETIGKIPDKVYEIFQKKIPIYRQVALEVLSEPIDFSTEETHEVLSSKRPYPTTDKQALKQWKSWVKYEVFNRLLLSTDPLEGTNSNEPNKRLKKFSISNIKYNSPEYKKKEKEAREAVKTWIKKYLITLEAWKPRDFFNSYLKSFGSSYDQYTTYHSPVEAETFNIDMSGQLEGIGVQIGKTEDGSIEVSTVIPGGPSFKQKALESGDRIFKAAQGENGKFVDLVPLTLNKAITYIRGKRGTKVKLLVRRVNGKMEEVTIVRDKVIISDLYTRSAVLKTSEGSYGYLKIPKFYGNPRNDVNARQVSSDVKNTIHYLNRKNVEGLIIDLRNNPGGYLEDAVKISQFFIGPGPVVRVKNRLYDRVHEIDQNERIIFKKPLIIMINESSASASEIFAAAMQDYGRAVIVGDEQSFGKATVQTVRPLQSLDFLKKFNKDFGTLKYTIQKYYRVTGQSTQTEGVKPDIILPGLGINPNFKRHSFPIDYLNPIQFNRWQQYRYPIASLSESSKERIKEKEFFVNMLKNKELIFENNNRTLFTLNYKKERDLRDQYLAKLNEFKLPEVANSKLFTVELSKEEINSLESSAKSKEHLDVEKTSLEIWGKDLRKDVYLEETVLILQDIISILKEK